MQTYPSYLTTPLRAYWGVIFNAKCILSKRSEVFLEYRPSMSFGHQNSGATRLLRAGIGYKF
jgi:hypothetical protein